MDYKQKLNLCTCGGKAILNKDIEGCSYVYCSKCGIGTLHRLSEKDVVDSWNEWNPNKKSLSGSYKKGYIKAVDDYTEKIINGITNADTLTLDSITDIIRDIEEQLKKGDS